MGTNYVDVDPINEIDPAGEFGIGGALFGVGVELGLQLYNNGGNLNCIDWWDVGVAAAVGAIGPGWLNVGKTTWTSGNAILTLSSQTAQTANRAAKIAGRIQSHKNQIKNIVTTQAAFQGAKAVSKAVNGSNQTCGCGNK